ncbi:MAG: glycosyltransferase family 39 protein [Proteobacteria bacterium]|nr:glycosyltransferase family 39 protein [Pseudomonadota bacterium]MBU4037122.1 glycosyltransferase family 39 protein [Pseudomonadota bacterium]
MIKPLLAGLTTILIISILILSSVPPVSRDALTHHLAVPKLYLTHGGIYEIPSLAFSYYPMNLDLMYLIPLYFGNDIAPKYIHFFFGLLTALLVFGHLKKRIDKTYALFGAIFFLSIPVIVKLSITAYVDLGLVFFSTASIIFLFKWIESDFKLKHLIVSAVFCGLSLGTKYNAIIVFALLSMFVVLIYMRTSHNAKNDTEAVRSVKALSSGFIFIVVSLLVFSPWMIRNYTWTKNPVYPLYNNLFNKSDTEPISYGLGMDNESLDKDKNKKLGPFAIRRIIYHESLLKTVFVPVRIFFEGEDGDPGLFDGKLSPFLFILPFFAFIRFKKDDRLLKTEKTILLSFSLLYILFAFFKVDMRIRYIAPVIPPLVILSVMGLRNIFLLLSERFSKFSGRIYQFCLFAFFAVIVSANAVYIVKQFDYVKPFGYLSGKVGRDEYIEKYRPEYAAFQYANKNLLPDVKILCLFLGNRRYYSDRELIFGDNVLINSVKSGTKTTSDMRKKGITHLLIGYDLFNWWIDQNLNDGEKIFLKKFLKENTALVFSKGGYGLLELH